MPLSRQPIERIRLYTVVGALVGLGCGTVLYGTFDLQGTAFKALWFAAVGLIGMVLGWLLLLAQEKPAQASTSPDDSHAGARSADDASEPEREGGTAQMVFYALPGNQSSSQLRTMRVSSNTAPMSPPPLDLRLVIEEFDVTHRLPVVEGVLDSLSAQVVFDRVRTVIASRLPATTPPAHLELVGFRSEGPLNPSGTCRFGWTFYLVDGRLGMACVATATRREVSLWFHTAPTYHEPVSRDWVDPAEVVAVVQAELPGWADKPIRLRYNAPEDILVFVDDPLVIADVDLRSRRVRNRSWILTADHGLPGPRATVADLRAWFRGEVPDSRQIFTEIEESGLRDALRTLQPEGLAPVGRALERQLGAETCLTLANAIESCTEPEECRELLHLLAAIPSGLAAPSLQRIAATASDAAVKALADDLFARRRRGRLHVSPDPIDPLRFDEARAAMGRVPLEVVALRSSYDVETDLIAPLCALGLRVTRRRLLAGEARVPLSVAFRAIEVDSLEALITSTPLPVPCHMLHLVGPDAAAWRARVVSAGLSYSTETIAADARSGTPYRAHVAALYIAAMQLSLADVAPGLIAAHKKGRSDVNLRKAIVQALGCCEDERALEFLSERAAVAEGPEREAIQEIETRLERSLAVAVESPRSSGSELRVRLSGPFNRV